MFNMFSPRYESGFRIFFVFWVVIWTFVNIIQLLYQYANFSAGSSTPLGQWWLNTVGTIIGLGLGLLLLFITTSQASSIRSKIKINGVLWCIVLVIFYYLFPTITYFSSIAIFQKDRIAEELVFASTWILPSLIIMVLHVLYYANISKYNESLASTNQS